MMRDSVTRKDKIRQLASANIRFETQKKEQENRLLTAEVRLQDTLLHVYSIAGVCALLLVFFYSRLDGDAPPQSAAPVAARGAGT